MVSGIATGSSEKKKDEGVGELSVSSVLRLEGLTVSGFISFVSFWLVVYQERTPMVEKRMMIKGKNLMMFCFMTGIISAEAGEIKL